MQPPHRRGRGRQPPAGPRPQLRPPRRRGVLRRTQLRLLGDGRGGAARLDTDQEDSIGAEEEGRCVIAFCDVVFVKYRSGTNSDFCWK